MYCFIRFSLLMFAAAFMAYAADPVTCAKGYYNKGGKCVPKNIGNNDAKTTGPSVTPGGSKAPGPGPTVEAQATVINSSRSNIRNNITVVQGPDGKVRCTSAVFGPTTACSARELTQLNTAFAGLIDSSKGGTSKSSSVKGVTQAKDGSLMCATASGTVPCGAAHLPDLTQGARAVGTNGIGK